jgi:hypothetical protein
MNEISEIEKKNPDLQNLPNYKDFDKERVLVLSNLSLCSKKIGKIKESIQYDSEVTNNFNFRLFLEIINLIKLMLD